MTKLEQVTSGMSPAMLVTVLVVTNNNYYIYRHAKCVGLKLRNTTFWYLSNLRIFFLTCDPTSSSALHELVPTLVGALVGEVFSWDISCTTSCSVRFAASCSSMKHCYCLYSCARRLSHVTYCATVSSPWVMVRNLWRWYVVFVFTVYCLSSASAAFL